MAIDTTHVNCDCIDASTLNGFSQAEVFNFDSIE